MHSSQNLNKSKFFYKITTQQRLVSAVIFLAMLALGVVLWLSGKGKIDLGLILNPCGLKQRFGLPCLTCGITTSAIAFFSGKIVRSFYIQPAGALLCTAVVICGFLAFLSAVFGVNFTFLKRLAARVRIMYIILAVVVIVLAGWAVTLSRALSAGN